MKYVVATLAPTSIACLATVRCALDEGHQTIRTESPVPWADYRSRAAGDLATNLLRKTPQVLLTGSDQRTVGRMQRRRTKSSSFV